VAAQGLKYLHGSKVTHGDLKGVSFPVLRSIPLLTCTQANILVSNETPPRALLADFGFMMVVPEPAQPMAHSAELEGGAMTFMSPELLIPDGPGTEAAVPTLQVDIYAFGLVIFQVYYAREIMDIGHSNMRFPQVLTGEMPFRGIRQSALAYHVFRGKRPDKPENSAVIGFSDSLWDFTERCWDGERDLRPKVGEVVARLKEAADSWGKDMPPHAEQMADSKKQGEFTILVAPLALPIEQLHRWNRSTILEHCPGEPHRMVDHPHCPLRIVTT